ncbi:hypothetical protein [Sphingobium aquiterrae]|uniref:hypothetical protein n=1 Tax=Sphingobium aquiterrae TaxID=2038656 RepID=UPI00301ACC55
MMGVLLLAAAQVATTQTGRPGGAQSPPAVEAPAAASVAGHYYLQGVMETGSEMLLKPDGHFQWYLVYGALDLFAEGRWTLADDKVVLTSTPSKDAPEPPFASAAFTLSEGRLIPPDGRGAYVRAEEEEKPAPAD